MNQNRPRPQNRVTRPLYCESLEGRALLSGLGPNLSPSLQTALVGKIKTGGIQSDPTSIAAITSALRGGPGNEFVSLLRRQIANPGALLRKFTSGITTQATITGVA